MQFTLLFNTPLGVFQNYGRGLRVVRRACEKYRAGLLEAYARRSIALVL